jgi:hypothetical protein
MQKMRQFAPKRLIVALMLTDRDVRGPESPIVEPMALLFEGFPHLLDPAALKPGRWFATSYRYEPRVCVMTEVSEDSSPIVLAFSQNRPECVDFSPILLRDLQERLLSLDYDIVFAPAGPGGRAPLPLPSRRAKPHGALLQLPGGDYGIGVSGRNGGFTAVSLSTGRVVEVHYLAFDHWSLTLRRGAMELCLGAYESEARRAARAAG